MKQRVLFILLIVAAVFAVYEPSLRNGYVWDDSALIQRDPFIRSWRLIPEGFRHFLFTDATASDFYRPIQRLTYTWDYAWQGFHPAIYHFDSILIHALAAIFLFLFLEELLTLFQRPHATEWAGLAATLWGIHPIFTSAVCYISGRADPLAGMFGFCGLWLALRNTKWSRAAAALMFFCAVCSKESGAIFMPLCLILLFLLRMPRRVIGKWVLLVLLVTAAAASLRLTAEHIAPPASAPLSWAARPIVALRAFAEYAGLFLAPARLHMERDVLPFGRGDMATTLRIARDREFQTLLGALLLAGLLFWMRWARRREPVVFAALICFIVAYLPICGLFALNASIAEHWLYVPGAFLMISMLLSATWLPISLPAGAFVIVAWAGFLGVRTWMRNFDWHDQRTFLECTIADGGDNARMLINLGDIELSEGRNRVAIADFQKALALSPDQPFAVLNLGDAYRHDSQFTLARQQFEKAAGYPLTRARAFVELALLDYQESQKDPIGNLQKAAEFAPDDWSIQKRYIMILAGRGDNHRAMTILRAEVTIEPWRADAWKLLGDMWVQFRQFDFATQAYRRAIELDVHDDDTRRKLASILARSGARPGG